MQDTPSPVPDDQPVAWQPHHMVAPGGDEPTPAKSAEQQLSEAIMTTLTDQAVPQAITAPAEALAAETARKIEIKPPPGVKVASNLDTYEKEKPEEPFWFQHEGEFFQMSDPEDVDFQDIVIGQENPRLMMHVLMVEDHRDRFFSKRLPMGKMKKLLGDYTKHYGLTDLGELAGSARSLNGTQGR